jgi:hypothetical protein
MMDNTKEKKAENVEDLKNKVYRTWYEDGIFEICFGICCIVIGLIFLSPVIEFMPTISRLSKVFLHLVLALAIVGVTFWSIRKSKEKVVWRKTGYSVIKDYYPKSVWIILSLILFSFGFAVFSIRFLSNEITIFLFGLVMAFAFVAEYIQAGKIKRFLSFSFLPPLIAGGSSLLGVIWEDSIFLVVYILGCALLISGVIVYMNFRRKLTE